MSYTVLARRYRSTSFSGVIGQEIVAQALRNAIATQRVAHAYLFTGTRGVGKTSMARILARALNAPDTVDDCPTAGDEHEYPDRDVQNRIAEAVMRGEDLNVIEIDGASNNSVDQARQLIANASLSPTGNARYKIYIIDEVHMLSGAAFNALLKTMEEPPGHVKFILCTTEPHKVPATIQSRCQRFDFRQIPTARITEHLRDVLKQESIEAQDQVVWRVAKLGHGSMRDALSLLDRLIAGFAGDGKTRTITVDLLDQMLGLPPQERVVKLIDAVADGDVATALEQTAGVLETGISQDQLIDVMIESLRQLMLICACGLESELVELSDDAKAQAVEQSKRFDAAGLVYMIALCENLQRSSKMSSNPRALLDATVARLALAEKMADLTALLEGGVAAKKKVAPPPSARSITPPFATPARLPTSPQPTASGTPAAGNGRPSRVPRDAPPTAVTLSQPEAVWQALLQKTADQRSLSWVRNLTMRGIEGQTIHIDTRPGCHDLKGFVTEARCQQIAKLLEPVVGQPVRVMFASTPGVSPGALPGVNRSSVSVDRPPHGSLSQSARDEAMKRPLVKAVLEVFDATIVDVRPVADEPGPARA